MTSYKKDIFDLFDENTSEALRLFCKNINQADTDVFIVMAHKAICLFNVLQEQNHIRINNKTIVSNFSLDYLESNSLEGKKITIIDDIMISGTAVASAANKAILCGANKNNINVIVLAIDTYYMKMQFINELNENVLKCDKYLEDDKCIKLSSDISNAFSYYGIPYDYDFPIYNNIKIDSDLHDSLFNNFFWNLYEVSNDYHKKGDVNTYLIFPKKVFLDDFYKSIGISFANSVNFVLKLYIKNYSYGESECSILPLCLFNEISKTNIDTLFEMLCPSTKKNDYLPEAKTRCVQYSLAHKLFLYFKQKVSLTNYQNIRPKDVNILFGNSFGNKMYSDFCAVLNYHNNKEITIECTKINQGIYDEFIDKSKNSDNLRDSKELERLNEIPPLLKPFIWWYDDKEIPVRIFLKENPVRFLDDYNSVVKEKISRLKSGFSFNTLVKILNITSADDKNALSIFIDRAIDLGILVPTIYYNEENCTICRAYRHGEDLPFALADQIRLLKFLLELEKNIKNTNCAKDINAGIAHVSFEKMIVAFYQIGLKQGNIFNRFLGFDDIDVMKPFLSVHGRVNGFVNPTEVKGKEIEEHFYSERAKIKDKESDYKYITWLSYWLEDQNFISKSNTDDKSRIFINKNNINDYVDRQSRNNIDNKIAKRIEKIGSAISEWYNYTLYHWGKDRFKEDATALTSCENIYVFASAIATEIHYFKNYWENQAKKAFNLDDFSLKEFAWEVIEQGLHSGRDKIKWYNDGRAQTVIDTIKKSLKEFNDWSDFWNIDKKPDDTDKSEIKQEVDKAIGYLYFYSACYDCLNFEGFWEWNELPSKFDLYEKEYSQQCQKNENLDKNLFAILSQISKISKRNDKKNRIREEISKVIIHSERTIHEIEHCIKASEHYYTVRYKSSLIFEVDPICAEKCDDYIMNVWNQLEEDDDKTQLNIIRFSDNCGNDNYVKYGLFFGSIKNNTYSIEYKPDVLINIYQKICEEFNSRAYSIRAIFIPQIPAGLIFEHNTYNNINKYSENFYNDVVSILEDMFEDDKSQQLVLLTTRYTPKNIKEVVEQVEWDIINDIGLQSFPLFTGDTYITKYSNKSLQLNENSEMRVSNSIVKIECGNSIGAGILIKTDNQVVCVTCNHIVSDYPDKITATMLASNNVTFDLKPIKEILPDIDNPPAEYEVSILEPQWDGKIPFNIDQLMSLNHFYDTSDATCDCCGFPNNEFRWESNIKISRSLTNGYKQSNNVDNIEEGFSGGAIVDSQNKFYGIHEGRFNDMNNGRMIPSSIIKKEIYKILGDYKKDEK